jgi:hypothetical protein
MKRVIIIFLFLLLGNGFCFSNSVQASIYLSHSEICSTGGDAAGNGGKGFESFSAFKKVYGSAGEGNAWHHIVEQTPGNIENFGAQQIHNVDNLMKLPHGKGSIHAQISGYYSSIQPFTGGTTVRQWLNTKSFDFQYNFGIEKLTEFGWKFK